MVGVKVPMGGSLVMMCLGAKAGWVGKRMGLSKGAQTGAVDVVVAWGMFVLNPQHCFKDNCQSQPMTDNR